MKENENGRKGGGKEERQEETKKGWKIERNEGRMEDGKKRRKDGRQEETKEGWKIERNEGRMEDSRKVRERDSERAIIRSVTVNQNTEKENNEKYNYLYKSDIYYKNTNTRHCAYS